METSPRRPVLPFKSGGAGLVSLVGAAGGVDFLLFFQSAFLYNTHHMCVQYDKARIDELLDEYSINEEGYMYEPAFIRTAGYRIFLRTITSRRESSSFLYFYVVFP